MGKHGEIQCDDAVAAGRSVFVSGVFACFGPGFTIKEYGFTLADGSVDEDIVILVGLQGYVGDIVDVVFIIGEGVEIQSRFFRINVFIAVPEILAEADGVAHAVDDEAAVLVGTDVDAALFNTKRAGEVVHRQVEGGCVGNTLVDAGGAGSKRVVVVVVADRTCGVRRVREIRIIGTWFVAAVEGVQGDVGRAVHAAFHRTIGVGGIRSRNVHSIVLGFVAPDHAVGELVRAIVAVAYACPRGGTIVIV